MKQITRIEEIPNQLMADIADKLSPTYLVMNAYNAGLRDGGKREKLTKVPEHVKKAFCSLTTYKLSDHKGWGVHAALLAALNAYIAGPSEQPADTEQQAIMSRLDAVGHARKIAELWKDDSDGSASKAAMYLLSLLTEQPAPKTEQRNEFIQCQYEYPNGRRCCQLEMGHDGDHSPVPAPATAAPPMIGDPAVAHRIKSGEPFLASIGNATVPAMRAGPSEQQSDDPADICKCGHMRAEHCKGYCDHHDSLSGRVECGCGAFQAKYIRVNAARARDEKEVSESRVEIARLKAELASMREPLTEVPEHVWTAFCSRAMTRDALLEALNADRFFIAGPSEKQEKPVDKKYTGLYRKFKVERTDGSSAPGGKHEHCEYFVLDLTHDKFAIPALQAYAKACRGEYTALACDLIDKVAKMISEGKSDVSPAPATADHIPDAAKVVEPQRFQAARNVRDCLDTLKSMHRDQPMTADHLVSVLSAIKFDMESMFAELQKGGVS